MTHMGDSAVRKEKVVKGIQNIFKSACLPGKRKRSNFRWGRIAVHLRQRDRVLGKKPNSENGVRPWLSRRWEGNKRFLRVGGFWVLGDRFAVIVLNVESGREGGFYPEKV